MKLIVLCDSGTVIYIDLTSTTGWWCIN